MVGVLWSIVPLSVILIVIIDTYDSSVVSCNKLANFVRIPIDGIAWTLAGDDDLFAFLSFLAGNIVV